MAQPTNSDQNNSNRPGSKGKMTVAEAGRKGGVETARTHGREFYEAIGRAGGQKVARERGSKFYSEIGRKGGEAVSRDRAHMAAIGQKGGSHSRRGSKREAEPADPQRNQRH